MQLLAIFGQLLVFRRDEGDEADGEDKEDKGDKGDTKPLTVDP